jgi:hypothetical protein
MGEKVKHKKPAISASLQNFVGASFLAQNFEKASFLAFSRSYPSVPSDTFVTFAIAKGFSDTGGISSAPLRNFEKASFLAFSRS